MNKNENLINWLKEKAAKAYEEKSLVLQLFPIFLLFSFFCLVLPILSGITEFTELYYEFNAKDSIGGLIMAILVLIAIEGVKVVSISICFVKWFSGKLSNIGVFLLLVFIAQGSSIYFSMQGSKRIPKMLHSEPIYKQPKLIDVDSIKVAKDSIIAAKEAIRDVFFKQYHKTDAITGEKRLSSTYAKDKRAQDMDIRTAEQDKKISVEKAEKENLSIIASATTKHKETLKAFKEQINVSSNKMWYWSIVIETFFFFSSLFVFWYLDKVRTDSETDNLSVSTPIKTKKERLTKTDKKTFKTFPKTGIAHLGNNNKERITDNCLACNRSITHKRSDAKFCDSKCRGEHFKMTTK